MLEAGGVPLEFPVLSLGETLMRPTSMMFRNLAAMDVEETLRANPLDGVVLLAGCDKTTPSLLMGAASCDLPALMVSGGPDAERQVPRARHRLGHQRVGVQRGHPGGKMTLEQFMDAEACMSRSAGHCMTMGTASTMACLVEALGMGLPGNAAIPAVDARRRVLAREAGRRICAMVEQDLSMSRIWCARPSRTRSWSTAPSAARPTRWCTCWPWPGASAVPLSLEDWDTVGRGVPCLVDLMPSGRALMEDFYYAGGLPAVMRELGERLHRNALTVNGHTLARTAPPPSASTAR